ncbi:MFS transporter [Planomonospora parontospora]|uniref:MFS transporter n=1 Tax=Planomonospora parontospora TaxID=58119 RepID=UPI0016705342|nr:MFS transporter [Planomonospora parontospora]GGL50185.1 MFS transporter [Planomonospora parontospora subsp. antibiotica]GII18952.1 MFS transporter [Planomonospora parontospora subsp. antibiotica]
MRSGHRLGRQFGWLWGAYGTSALGTWLAFGAFPLIAVQVLHAGPEQVAALSSVGALAGAAAAVPLGPWVEFRRKRPVLIGTDLVRFAALLTIPAAFALGVLSFVQLLLVSVVVAAADITFRAASGAYLKTLLPAEHLLVANARFESTAWTTTVIGPPLGGAAIGLLGPVVTVAADAVSYLLSALGIGAAGGREPRPERRRVARVRAGDLLDGWRYILADPTLRPLFFNTAAFNGLVMATDALLAVLMLGRLGFAPWQYGLAFAAPAIGGLLGSRLARPLTTRFGQHRVLVVAGTLRAIWPIGLAFLGPGTGGLLLVMGVELGLIFCCGVFNPVYATYRLERTAPDRVARTLSAWTVTTRVSTALLTAVWGVLGGLLGPHTAIGLAGVLLLATPLLLPRRAATTGSTTPGNEQRCTPLPVPGERADMRLLT